MACIEALAPLYAMDHYARSAGLSTLQMSNATSRSNIDQARDSNLAFSPDWAEESAKQVRLNTTADTAMAGILSKLAHGWPSPLTGGT
jgi:hypothetical protein